MEGESTIETVNQDAGASGAEAEPNAASQQDANATAEDKTVAGEAGDGAKAEVKEEGAKADTDKEEDPENMPVQDWKKVDFQFDEDVQWDKGVLESFGKQAQELGLTPKQMKALAKWQTAQAAEYRQAQIESGIAELKKEWGNRADANQKAALAFISQIDRRLQSRNPKLGESAFSGAIAKCGAACDVNFIRGLHVMASMIAEDSVGAAPGANAEKPETPDEFFKKAFANK